MKLNQTTNTTYAVGIVISSIFSLLLLLAIFVPFRFLLSPTDPSKNFISKGAVQEEVGYRIMALARFDQDRQAQLQQDGEKIFQQTKNFVNSRSGQLQEALGLAITQTDRSVLTRQARLKEAVNEAKEKARRFNEEKAGRWQE